MSTTVPFGRKIRLLIVTQNLDYGGLEEVILMYARFLDRSRYDVAVACRVQGVVSSEIGALPGVRLFSYDAPRKWQRLILLWRFTRAFKPDIVHNHFNWYGLILGWLVGAKRVETIHNTYHWFPMGQRIAYNCSCLFASRIIAVSEHVRQFSREFFPLLKLKEIDVVHNGIDTTRFQRPPDEHLRQELGVSRSTVVIGFIGRLEQQKGVIYLLHAVAELTRDFSNFNVILVGEGTLKQKLQETVTVLGLTNVRFVGFRRDIPQAMQTFDVFVLPSLFEGLPVVLIEAMAAGCAVVATRIGGVEEVVTDGVNGMLVEPAKVSALADALRRLLADPALRKRLGEEARKNVAQEFSSQVMVARTEAVYRRLVPYLFEATER